MDGRQRHRVEGVFSGFFRIRLNNGSRHVWFVSGIDLLIIIALIAYARLPSRRKAKNLLEYRRIKKRATSGEQR